MKTKTLTISITIPESIEDNSVETNKELIDALMNNKVSIEDFIALEDEGVVVDFKFS